LEEPCTYVLVHDKDGSTVLWIWSWKMNYKFHTNSAINHVPKLDIWPRQERLSTYFLMRRRLKITRSPVTLIENLVFNIMTFPAALPHSLYEWYWRDWSVFGDLYVLAIMRANAIWNHPIKYHLWFFLNFFQISSQPTYPNGLKLAQNIQLKYYDLVESFQNFLNTEILSTNWDQSHVKYKIPPPSYKNYLNFI
jgi:hypothetical protein